MGKTAGKTRAANHRRLARFLRDKRGAFAMQFALMVIPLVLCVGLAIDGGRVFLARFNLMSALDAAALAMGSTTDDTVDLNAMASLYVAQNFRMADTGTVVLTSDPTTVTSATETITLKGTVPVQTYFMPLAGISSVNVSAESVVKRGGADVEVAMVLDTTRSMQGTRISDLQAAATELVNIVVSDVQTPYYSKIAMIPYSNSVYVGSFTDTVRGAEIPGKVITAGTSAPPPPKAIYNIEKTYKPYVYSTNHGLSSGDIITIDNVNGMTQINGNTFKISYVSSNRFRIKYYGGPYNNQWVNSSYWSDYTSGGEISSASGSCPSGCEAVLTSPNHGFSNGDFVRIDNASGWSEMNNSGDNTWELENVTTDTFQLKGSDASGWGTYTANSGTAYCTTGAGCRYYRYTGAGGGTRVKQLSQCVTERVGSEVATDASYTVKGVGYKYPIGTGVYSCPTDNPIVPLTATKSTLTTAITNLSTEGSTAGHIGLAWGYYALSDEWNTLWPSASQQAGAMDATDLVKAIVLMTDGIFNVAHCNGVSADDSQYGGDDQINCDAENGDSYAQATALCNAIKADGINIYTVGFAISAGGDEEDFLSACASSEENYYLASNGTELTAAFQSIAKSISLLRLAQ